MNAAIEAAHMVRKDDADRDQTASGNPGVSVQAGQPTLGLTWPIKSSFQRYLSHMPDGRCSSTAGAESINELGFRFAITRSQSEQSGHSVVRFYGEVRFTGHHGLLNIRICDPWVYLAQSSGLVSIIDPEADPGQDDRRLNFARFTVGPRTTARSIQGTDVRLTAEGSELFFGVYPCGEPLDDLTVTY